MQTQTDPQYFYSSLSEFPLGKVKYHIFAVYKDADEAMLLAAHYEEQDSMSVSIEVADHLIGLMRDHPLTTWEGYDDDPTATIWWPPAANALALALPSDVQAQFMAMRGRLVSQHDQKLLAMRQQRQSRNPLTGHFVGGARGEA